MKISNLNNLKPKALIVFDLDGTMAPSKTPMDREMCSLVEKLLMAKQIAVIGGGKYDLFKEQLLAPLDLSFKRKLRGVLPTKQSNMHKGLLRPSLHRDSQFPGMLYKNLFLFPTTSTSFYRYNGKWVNVYAHQLSVAERSKIKKTFQKVMTEIGYKHSAKTYGKIIEDRGTQITWSALGQDVVKVLGKEKGVALKDKWRDENTPVKLKIARLMSKYLPEFSIRAAGHTSVDVTKKGIDKAYGLKQIEKYLGVKIKDMLFIGDAIFPGGNDYAVTKTKVDYVPVKGPEETKKIIRHIVGK